MQLRTRVHAFQILILAILFPAFPVFAQDKPAASSGGLTVERIYSQPSLSGRLTRGIAWTPDNKKVSFFETKGTGKDSKAELWLLDTASGERIADDLGRVRRDLIGGPGGQGPDGHVAVADGAVS